jgi:hypothetical protein
MKNLLFLSTLLLVFVGISCQRNACAKRVCLNGGSCVDGNCQCPDGFTGLDCESKIDKCRELGCDTLHSDCDPNSLSPKCNCHEGWEGVKCNKPWSDKFLGNNFVASQLCDGGGTDSYSVEVEQGTKFNSFVITNFHNKANTDHTSKILCELRTPYNFTIDPQPMYYGFVLGRGELSFDNKYIEVVYKIVPLGTTDTLACSVVLERQ